MNSHRKPKKSKKRVEDGCLGLGNKSHEEVSFLVRLVSSGIFMHAIVTSSWYCIVTRRIDLKHSHSTKKKKEEIVM